MEVWDYSCLWHVVVFDRCDHLAQSLISENIPHWGTYSVLLDLFFILKHQLVNI